MTIPPKSMRCCPAVAAGLAGMLLSTGCVVIPVDYYQAGSRQNLTPRTLNLILVGYSSMTVVLI